MHFRPVAAKKFADDGIKTVEGNVCTKFGEIFPKMAQLLDQALFTLWVFARHSKPVYTIQLFLERHAYILVRGLVFLENGTRAACQLFEAGRER